MSKKRRANECAAGRGFDIVQIMQKDDATFGKLKKMNAGGRSSPKKYLFSHHQSIFLTDKLGQIQLIIIIYAPKDAHSSCDQPRCRNFPQFPLFTREYGN